MQSSRRRLLIRVGLPLALAGGYLLVDRVVDEFAGDPWPRTAHLAMAALLLGSLFVILTIYQKTLSQREQARTTLAAREASYRALFDLFPEPTTVWNGDGVLLMQNLVSARTMGGQREDFIGKTVADLFGTEDGHVFRDRLQRVLRTGVVEEQEDTVALPSGQRTYWTAMQRIQRLDGDAAIQVISYDITKRVQAEQAWRAEHARAASYLTVAGVMIVALDLDGRITLINAKGCEILGCQVDDAIGKDWFEAFVPGAIREVARRDFAHLIAGGDASESAYEHAVLTVAGAEPRIAWNHVVLRDEAGRPVGTLSSGEDITARRGAEAALRASEALRIQERTALEERQRIARELHDSVSQALYGIALGANAALAVMERDREAAREALMYAVGLARAGLSEMRALIFELRPESLASEGLIAALRKQVEALHARFEIDVDLELCDEPDLPLAAKEALYRISQEALHNAIKHAHARTLRVGLACDGRDLTLTIQDDGRGFDPQAIYPGHLGLRSMQERAASIGGALRIESAPGAGTCIHVNAPLPGGV